MGTRSGYIPGDSCFVGVAAVWIGDAVASTYRVVNLNAHDSDVPGLPLRVDAVGTCPFNVVRNARFVSPTTICIGHTVAPAHRVINIYTHDADVPGFLLLINAIQTCVLVTAGKDEEDNKQKDGFVHCWLDTRRAG